MRKRPEATGSLAATNLAGPLFSRRFPYPMTTATKDDVLASNLLFGVLAISLIEQLAAAYLRNQDVYVYTPGQTISVASPTNWFVTAAVWLPLLLGMLVAGGSYYAVRKGKRWAKLLVLVAFLWSMYSSTVVVHGQVGVLEGAFLWSMYSSTSRQDGLLLGVPVAHLLSWALLAWFKAALTLAALVLMFWPARKAALL